MVGKCFFYDTPPNAQHLFVVLAPSLDQRDWFICVNLTTKRSHSDPTCEVRQGEHPNLTAPISVAVYAEARELPVALIERESQKQQIPNLSEAVLSRIQQAPLADHSRLKNRFKAAIRHYLESKGA